VLERRCFLPVYFLLELWVSEEIGTMLQAGRLITTLATMVCL